MANGLEYAINLYDKGFAAGIRKAKDQTKGLDRAVNKAGGNIKRTTASGSEGFRKLKGSIAKVGAAIGIAFALGGVINFGNEVTRVTAQFESMGNAITFSSGKEAGQNMTFLNDTIKDMSLDMTAAYSGFKNLSGSLMGTSLEGKATRDIFEAVGMASTVMGLSAEESLGAFQALGQMASKGKVSAEELRGQLGERLPGALKIAADAMGVSQIQLNKMLDEGKLYAEDFLPKFAKALKDKYAGGLDEATNSMQSAINRQKNAMLQFKLAAGETFRPVIMDILAVGAELFNWLKEFIPQLEPVKQAFGNLLTAFQPIIDAFGIAGEKAGGASGIINGLAAVINMAAVPVGILSEGIGFLIENFALLGGAIGAYLIYQKAAIVWQRIAVIQRYMAITGTSLFTLAQRGLNAAMKANPIGLIITAITVLVGLVTYAWKKLDWFRGGIMAAWEAIKGFAKAIKDQVIRRFKELLGGISGIGKAILLFFKGDWEAAWKTGKEATKKLMGVESGKQFIDDMREVGKKSGEAYQKGVAQVNAEKTGTKGIDFEAAKGDMAAATATANSKFLNTDATKQTNQNNGLATTPSKSVATGGGRTEKHTTFNIQSLVGALHLHTPSLKDSPAAVKKQIERIFTELIADVEVRAAGV